MTELTCPRCQQLCPQDGRYCAECGCKLVIDVVPSDPMYAADPGEDAQAREGTAS